MNKNEIKITRELLKLYPDVVADLGGDQFLNNDSEIEQLDTYISDHKWFVNEKLPFTVTMEEAFFSWYENVYKAQWIEMVETNIAKVLKGLSKFEVFVKVSDEYYYQQQKNLNATYTSACEKLIERA